jgi:uncharacterized membrane protein
MARAGVLPVLDPAPSSARFEERLMSALTSLGIVHTAISLVAVGAGVIALVRDREISPATRVGQVYLWATVLTCLTGFGIFQHGGFGKPHALGVLTLLLVAAAWAAPRVAFLGRHAGRIATAIWSTTFFLHWIPGVTETTTRLPPDAPIFANADDPTLAQVIGLVAVVALVLIVLQWRRGDAAPPIGLGAGAQPK